LKKLSGAAALSIFLFCFFSCASRLPDNMLPESLPGQPETPPEDFEAAPEIIEIIDDSDDDALISTLPEPEIEDKPQIVPLPEETVSPFEAPVEFVRAEPVYTAVPVAAAIEAGEPPPQPEAPAEDAATAAEREAPLPPPVPAPPPLVKPAEREPPAQAAAAPVAPVSLPARIHPTETQPKEKDNFSREIRAVSGQLVEVPFWGSGWVFLGEANAARGLSYDSRRLDDDGQTFVFRAAAPGEYFLKFNKQDYVSNYYANDTVKVTVGENVTGIPLSLNGARVSAPRWAPKHDDKAAAAPPRPEAAGQNSAAAPPPEAASAPPDGGAGLAARDVEEAGGETPGTAAGPPDAVIGEPAPDYLAQARGAFDAGNFAGAISALDLFRYSSPALDDEAWWLYGQSFEANSPARDIKAALDSYQHITREFPQSPRYDTARSRIAYLNKFYFNIR
jgi:hypothetical protein